MRKVMVPLFLGLLAPACGSQPASQTAGSGTRKVTAQDATVLDVTTDEVNLIRHFKGKLDEQTIDAWVASVGKVSYMPYDQLIIDEVSDDGTKLTVTLMNKGVLIRSAILALGENYVSGPTKVFKYSYDELTVYNHFQLDIEVQIDVSANPAVIKLARITSKRDFTLTPQLNARATADYKP